MNSPRLKNQKSGFTPLLFIVLLLTFLAFSPSLNNEYVNWDDHAYVVNNDMIKDLSWAGIGRIFQSYVVGNYQPLCVLSFAIEYHLAGLSPHVSHWINLILHMVNVVLVYLFVCHLTGYPRAAILAAVLFGIHPMHVESVAWVSGRKDVLFMIFYLLALIAYTKHIKSSCKDRVMFWHTGMYFFLSLLSKPTAISLPVVLLLLDYYFDRKPKNIFKEKWMLFALSAIFLTVAIKGTYSDLELFDGLVFSYTVIDRLAMVSYALILYVAKVFLPIQLSVFYPNPWKVYGLLPGIYYFAMVLIGMIGCCYLSGKRLSKLQQFGILLFLVTIFLNLPVVNVGYVIIAERFTYLPYIGLFIILSVQYDQFLSMKKASGYFKFAAKVLCFLFIFWCVCLTTFRCEVWKNSETLWTDVIQKFPHAAVAYHNRGLFYYGQKEYDLAEQDFKRAIGLEFNYLTAYFNLGNIAARRGDSKTAIGLYTKALAINPKYYYAYNNRGGMYQLLGEGQKALQDFDNALTIKPDFQDALTNRANLLKKLEIPANQ